MGLGWVESRASVPENHVAPGWPGLNLVLLPGWVSWSRVSLGACDLSLSGSLPLPLSSDSPAGWCWLREHVQLYPHGVQEGACKCPGVGGGCRPGPPLDLMDQDIVLHHCNRHEAACACCGSPISSHLAPHGKCYLTSAYPWSLSPLLGRNFPSSFV